MSKEKLAALASYQQLPPELRSVVKLALLHGIPGPEAVSMLNLANPTRTWEADRIQRVLADYGTADSDWISRLEAAKGTSAPSTDQQEPISQPGDLSQNPPQSNQALTDGKKQPISGQTVATCQKEGCDRPVCTRIPQGDFCGPHGAEAAGYRAATDAQVAPAAPAFDKPIRTTRPCVVCKDRLAWYDGNACGPCATGQPGDAPTGPVILGGESGVDVGDLFPDIDRKLPNGMTTRETWQQQQWNDDSERDRLVGQLIEQRRREAEQAAHEISKVTHSSRLIGRR